MSIDERKRLIDRNIYFFYKKPGYRTNAYPDRPAGRGRGTFKGRGRGRNRGRSRRREIGLIERSVTDLLRERSLEQIKAILALVEDANSEVLPFTDAFIEEANL
ncbi:hypothetical protein G7Y89_g5542 [Cudoniella acicularis]|uniref:Uncharacterized protein n=1 Tax=Cudoniella acicularis TaxID=354080 RepID=A0A8H4RPH4_9HELO|nr:hypothetical protein G7Y89_g5542 [Cudoniella acicularis]